MRNLLLYKQIRSFKRLALILWPFAIILLSIPFDDNASAWAGEPSISASPTFGGIREKGKIISLVEIQNLVSARGRQKASDHAEFANCSFPPRTIATLVSSGTFDSVAFTACALTRQNLGELAGAVGLRKLKIAEDKVNDRDLSSIGELSDLEELCLDNTLVNGEILSEISDPSKLISLSLNSTNLDDSRLEICKRFRNLRKLSIKNTSVSGKKFLSICPLSYLSELDVTYCSDIDDWFHVMSMQPKLDWFNSYGSFSSYVCLRRLSDVGLNYLNQDYPSLRSLNLSRSKVSAKGLEALIHFPNLSELKLDALGLSGTGLDHLNNLKALRVLWLNSNPLTIEGIESISKLIFIRELRVAGSLPKGKSSIRSLSRLNLVSLEVSANVLTPSDFNAIEKMKSLRRLILNGELIEAWQMKAIAQCTQLKVLDLRESRGLSKQCLKPLIRERNLTNVDLWDSDITTSDEQWLQDNLPRTCKLEAIDETWWRLHPPY